MAAAVAGAVAVAAAAAARPTTTRPARHPRPPATPTRPGAPAPTSQGDEGEGGTRAAAVVAAAAGGSGDGENDDPPGTITRVREPRSQRDEPTAVKGSTRLEAKKQRRREGREAGRRRTIITEAEFLARRESVERVMVVRGRGDRTQIGVLEDGVLVEHYVSRETTASMAGNVYLGRVQNVLPSMEAAFVDIGKGRNAVLYAGEVNWDAAGLEGGQARRIENALSSGDTVLTQVTKDPIGHKGARLTSQISLPGRYLVYVPEGQMTGISRKLPDTERARLKAILKEVVPDHAGVIVRTAAEGASRGGAARRRRAAHQDLGQDQGQGRVGRRQEGRQRRRPGAAARRARPDRARHPRRVHRGLHLAGRLRRQGLGRGQPVRRGRRARPGAAPAALDGRGGRLRGAPHRRVARQGDGPQGVAALAVARWSSTAPRR